MTVATKKRKVVKKKSRSTEEPVSFEESLQTIEQSVTRLESGNLGLSEALEEYERGIRELKLCHELLERAERRIELLTGIDAAGNPVTQEYQEDATEAEGSAPGAAQGSSRRARIQPESGTRSKLPTAGDDVDEEKRLF